MVGHEETQKEPPECGVLVQLKTDLLADLATLAVVAGEDLQTHIERALDGYVNGKRRLLDHYKKTQKDQGDDQ